MSDYLPINVRIHSRSTAGIGITIAIALTACLTSVRVSQEKDRTAFETPRLVLATTTSTADSGLLDFILPTFERAYNVKVDVVAVGTGQALALGKSGDADILLVHDPSQEEIFMQAGYGRRRETVMYNDFVIVGPSDDPAAVRGLESAVEAFKRIAVHQALFISRADESGTHAKEQEIWQAAGIVPEGAWYLRSGQGMGEALAMADEQQAYILSDRATYLAHARHGTRLVILVEGDPVLRNPYSVIIVRPRQEVCTWPSVADQFVDWLISVETQQRIGSFGVEEFGQPLFTPDSVLWRAACASSAQSTEE